MHQAALEQGRSELPSPLAEVTGERSGGDRSEHALVDQPGEAVGVRLEGRRTLGMGQDRQEPTRLQVEQQLLEQPGDRRVRGVDQQVAALAQAEVAHLGVLETGEPRERELGPGHQPKRDLSRSELALERGRLRAHGFKLERVEPAHVRRGHDRPRPELHGPAGERETLLEGGRPVVEPRKDVAVEVDQGSSRRVARG